MRRGILRSRDAHHVEEARVRCIVRALVLNFEAENRENEEDLFSQCFVIEIACRRDKMILMVRGVA